MPPTHATTDLQIAQKAAILAGMTPPESFDQADLTEAIALNSIYEDVVRDCLTATPWNFATTEAELTDRLDPPVTTRFNTIFEIPAGLALLQVRAVLIGGHPVSSWDIFDQGIALDCGPTEVVRVEYIRRVAASGWPPWFGLYVILRLAAMLATSVARSGDLAESFVTQAGAQLMLAKARDAQQVTGRPLNLGRFAAVRRGGR